MEGSHDPIRVLYVDDPAAAASAAASIEREAAWIEVEPAASAAEALDRLPAAVDCLVSGYELPDRTGIEFLEAVREDHTDLPFVLFPVAGSETIASEAIAAGVTDYLPRADEGDQYDVLAARVTDAVERRRAARGGGRSTGDHRLVAETATDASWTLDPETGRIEIAGLRAFGYDDDDHDADRSWWTRRIHPDDRERVLARDEALLTDDPDAFDERDDDRGWFSQEYRWRRADGTYADCAERGAVLFADRKPVKMVGTMTDISERREQERTLRRYERMVNTMQEAACIYDEAGRFELANEYLAEFYGTTREALEGAESALIPRIRAEATGDPYRELLDGERTEIVGEVGGEFPGVGHEVLAYRLTPLIVSGSVEGVVGVAREVTERKRRERDLERTNTLLSTLFETLPVGVAVLDVRGRVVRANRRAESIGLAVTDGAGRTYDDLDVEFVDDDGEPIPTGELPFAHVIDTGAAVSGHEYGIRSPDGSERWVSVDAAPLAVDAEATERVVTVLTDITDRRDDRRALEQRNERLDEFASIVGHDLRNPLNVAIGALNLVRDERDDTRLDTVARAHERMNDLIDDLLALARGGRDAIEPGSVDLADCSEACWRTVDTAETTLVTDVDRTIRADRSRLQQLFENLYRNAIEHGGRDGTVTVGELDDGFYVADDGPGIPAEERDDVFDSGHSGVPGGTGFGLSIVRGVAQAHGWTVDVTDGADGGARIELTGVEFVGSPGPAGGTST